jgi:hypothetical protein
MGRQHTKEFILREEKNDSFGNFEIPGKMNI